MTNLITPAHGPNHARSATNSTLEVIGADHGSTITFTSDAAVPVEVAGVAGDGRRDETSSTDPQGDRRTLLDWHTGRADFGP
ncbi:hypothetical protein [Amycolatopsis sp. FDAARGOS 1241]|uniref:hypothetical protein n=1 Tax=Amycolatopsis sp. FDAARGOS 1241 TaxID=2778070 RepID=UPI00194E636F|nr:hypothetical protein [Amycolatopsis sp. FDAARGOS 1241]QRP45985.1 hypothetical protein I6J71_44175 [Amycolatopsis sp. FDAARGOS 1241]